MGCTNLWMIPNHLVAAMTLSRPTHRSSLAPQDFQFSQNGGINGLTNGVIRLSFIPEIQNLLKKSGETSPHGIPKPLLSSASLFWDPDSIPSRGAGMPRRIEPGEESMDEMPHPRSNCPILDILDIT